MDDRDLEVCFFLDQIEINMEQLRSEIWNSRNKMNESLDKMHAMMADIYMRSKDKRKSLMSKQ